MIDRCAVTVILLAAGLSQRFGAEDKLLAELGEMPLALHAARRAAALRPAALIAVIGPAAGPLPEALAPLGYELLTNSAPERGLASSLKTGIAAAAQSGAGAALVCLADMPFVSTAHLEALLNRFDAEQAPVVASEAGGRVMPPALFARSAFGELLAAEGDEGGRGLLKKKAVRITAPAGELADIDVVRDLRAAKAAIADGVRDIVGR